MLKASLAIWHRPRHIPEGTRAHSESSEARHRRFVSRRWGHDDHMLRPEAVDPSSGAPMLHIRARVHLEEAAMLHECTGELKLLAGLCDAQPV